MPQIVATTTTGAKSNTGRNVGIAIVLLVVVVGGFLFLTQGSSLSPIRPSTVAVTGSVSTKGFGTHPVNVGFTSDNGQLFNAAVVNSQYSVNLPNDHTYSVQVAWSGALGASGTCQAGSLSVSQGPGSSGLTNDWTC